MTPATATTAPLLLLLRLLCRRALVVNDISSVGLQSFSTELQPTLLMELLQPTRRGPKEDRGTYRSLLDSRLMRVLNDHVPLGRGYPVEGLLCGCSYQLVPESCNRSITVKLILVDDSWKFGCG